MNEPVKPSIEAPKPGEPVGEQLGVEKIESAPSLEQANEKIAEKAEVAPSASAPVVVAPNPEPVKELSPAEKKIKEIEKILEEDLGDIYFNLTDEKKIEFKVKGDEATKKINSLLQETKIRAKKIIEAIIDWLKVIPGVDKFFLEQEAKIKTDKILLLQKI